MNYLKPGLFMLRFCLLGLCFLFLLFGSCKESGEEEDSMKKERAEEDIFGKQREAMVVTQIESRAVKDPLVLKAMREVPRHLFVPENLREVAYADGPLPIGEGQTISQPYIVALMTELLDLKGGEKVLEIGTGSGYQAAILAEIASEVYTIEIIKILADRAESTLKSMDYENITVRCGDGYQGWKEHAPFDGIMVTAAPDHIPQPLVDQLKIGARLVIPVGDLFQELIVVTRTKKGIEKQGVIPVRFVPMTGEAEKK